MKNYKQILEGFNWDEYDKKMNTLMSNSKIKIKYTDIFQKGKKALMGTVKAAKLNSEAIDNIGSKTSINLYRF